MPPLIQGQGFSQKPVFGKVDSPAPTKMSVKTLSQGHGREVTNGDFVRVQYLQQAWGATGSMDNSYDTDSPVSFQVGSEEAPPAWQKALLGKRAGSRVEIIAPSRLAFGPGGPPAMIPDGTVMMVVIDIMNTVTPLTAPSGSIVSAANGIPTVSTNMDGHAPHISVPKGSAPRKLVSRYVIEGRGEGLRKAGIAIVAYKTLVWKSGKQISDFYGRGNLQALAVGRTIPGFAEGLRGKKVGSRIILVIPRSWLSRTPPTQRFPPTRRLSSPWTCSVSSDQDV